MLRLVLPALVLAVACHEPEPGDVPDRDEDVQPPPPVCAPAVGLVDVADPDRRVGDGSPTSCTAQALQEALDLGGTIALDCGDAPHTIALSAPLIATVDAVIDGAGTVTLDAGGTSRILEIPSSFELDTPWLTVQRLTFVNGASEGSGDTVDEGGGALFRRGGRLDVVDCLFYDNHCPVTGQDVAGGAVYGVGGGPTRIEGSAFAGNWCSNGGAVGSLHNDVILTNSTLSDNAATGTGGNPGNGGNGGALYMDGTDQDLSLCGVVIADNFGNAYGGGLFRVSNDATGTATLDRITVDGNGIPDQSPSKAGGLYLQGLDLRLLSSTISHNTATSDGGLFLGPRSTVTLENTTIAENTALSSLAGGFSIGSEVTGEVVNCTIARNLAPGELAFAAATVGTGVELRNTLVDGHSVGNGWNPISCRDPLHEGGGNLQWPVDRSGGGSDDPDALCTPSILVADSQLGELVMGEGPTATIAPSETSPARGRGTDCPPTDQRGQPRSEPCTSGAVELTPAD